MRKGNPAPDISGQCFHFLTVICRSGTVSGQATWNCVCRCGNNTVATGRNLRTGHTKSCGCLSRKLAAVRAKSLFTKHGHFSGRKSSRAHNSYQAMIARCTKPSHTGFYLYGGRGVSVCQRWLESFGNFLADMGAPPIGCSIDRWPDKTGNYEPSNCRWATGTEQSNNRSNNRVISHDGVTMSIAQWARHLGIDEGVLRWRVNAEWSSEKTITTPVRHKAIHKKPV